VKKYELLRNRALNNQRLFLALLCSVLLLAGCAGHLPPTIPLTGAQEEDASALVQRIQERRCPDFLDADVTINWQGYGQNHTLSATLQVTEKNGLRVSFLDPLFRPFLILAAGGTTFILVDNQQGRAYTGQVNSTFLHKYIPAGLQLSTCFSLLAARFPPMKTALLRCARSKKENTYWFVFTGKNGGTQHLEIDPDSGLILRQLLIDADHSIILDVRYDSYQPLQKDCLYPVHIFIEGKDISGSMQISLDKLYNTPLADEIFHLKIPEHFKVTEVE
jgi:hypothetical protein